MSKPRTDTAPTIIGAVAYDPKAVTIWEVIRDYFAGRPARIDYRLFSNYESQVDALFAGEIDIAWNTPVAWVKAKRRSEGQALALAMRDADVGFTTKLIARTGAAISGPKDVAGKTLAVGSRDSGQAAILPVHFLRREGLVEGRDYRALRFDIDVGKHGDTGASELEVVRAVAEGHAQAGALGDSTWARLVAEGVAGGQGLTAVWTSPGYSHCNFTALPGLSEGRGRAFVDGLLAMDYADPALRPMMDLEGLKRWVEGRTTGYELLEEAMKHEGMA
jgi:phosphonate transport system substrate-binding protein